ncbi:MAG: ATP-dependent Clp protease ATP-binding subunit [Polyangiaceae bacterium]|nr:ATP-dependent Clp protease ATP-binding subunit [Polyangiaceae bacterium]
MHFSIPVYQQRESHGLLLTCVGLGGLMVESNGANLVKAEANLIKQLKSVIQGTEPLELERFDSKRGTKLQRVHLELNLKVNTSKVSLSGIFPLILEPRWVGEERELIIAYHPRLPHKWFPVRDDEPLEALATRYFGKAWADVKQHELGKLATNGKDRLSNVAFNAEPKSPFAKLKRTTNVWADLEFDEERSGKPKVKRGMRVLHRIAEDLTAQHSGLTPGPTSHRPLQDDLAHLVCGPKKHSVLVVGDSGVGKTRAIIQLVHDLLEADDYPTHRNLDRVFHVWKMSGQRLIAGMSHIGDWEERAVQVLQDCADHKVVLYVEDIHAFGQIGRHRGSNRSLADFFVGPLARKQLTIVSECTPSQLERLEYDAPSFADAFTRLNLPACDPGKTLMLAFQESRSLGHSEKVRVDPFALRSLVELGSALLRGSELPGRVMDPLDSVIRGASDPEQKQVERVGNEQVLEHLSGLTGLPVALFEATAALDAEQVAERLSQRVMGQPEGIRAASDLILRIRAGLTDSSRPYGVYLLTGPTGTGKTELAKAITQYLYRDDARLVRLDMGEFSGPDAAARLIGDRYSPRGMLTAPLQAQPFSVVLLDEIEKAHSSALYLLLQVFDAGRLTDASGATADFSRSVILMTSNLGASSRAPVGFGDASQRILGDISKAVREFFPPELFNRIDRVVPFAPLTREVAESIVEAEVSKLLARRGLTDNDCFVFVHKGALRQVVDAAFEARDGARGVKRFLEREVTSLLTDALASGGRAKLRVFRVYFADGSYRLLGEKLEEAENPGQEPPMARLLSASVSELAAELPKSLALLDELLAGGALSQLAKKIAQLTTQAAGAAFEGEASDALFHTDALRTELVELHDRLERMVGRRSDKRPDGDQAQGQRTPHGRDQRIRVPRGHHDIRSSFSARGAQHELFELHARVRFLGEALARLEDSSRHRVLIELSQIGRERRRLEHQGRGGGLLLALTRAFGSGFGELAEFSARLSDGRVRYGDKPQVLAELMESSGSKIEHLVLKIVGPLVYDRFFGETGTHAWTTTAFGSELVRVVVTRSETDVPCGALIEAHLEQILRFERALDEGLVPIPENPLKLLPMVRRLTYDPPLGSDEPERGPLLVEDYRLGYVEEISTRSLEDAIRRCLWLGVGTSTQEGEAS